MSNNTKKSTPFDVATVEALVALMTQHDLSEIYLRDGGQHVRLRRGGIVASAPAAPAHHAPAPAAHASPAAHPAEPKAAAPAAAKKNLIEIKSETVGTFYAQPKPGEPPFVKVGDRVTPNKPVGIVVVMKTHNEIVANCTGVIVEVLVKDEQFIDFGQVLFRVDPEA